MYTGKYLKSATKYTGTRHFRTKTEHFVGMVTPKFLWRPVRKGDCQYFPKILAYLLPPVSNSDLLYDMLVALVALCHL